MIYTGSCLCGGVRYAVRGPLAPIQLCHCRQCRKAQGSAFVAVVPVPRADFELQLGDALIAAYESSPGKRRHFCGRCGSPLYSSRETAPDILRLRVGTLDDPVETRPAFHAWAGAAGSWWTITDSLPRYAEASPAAQHAGAPP